MSTNVNYKDNYLVAGLDYTGRTTTDIYQRFQVEASVLPVVYTGLAVTAGSGLTANVSAGTARGFDLTFTQTVNSPAEPTKVELTGSTPVTIPASTTGWIVLNVNVIGILNGSPVTPGPTQQADYYQINIDNGSGSPVPVFTTTLLSPNPNTTFPFTQIVLAQVTTNASVVTNIDTTIGVNRSFDLSVAWQNALNPGQVGDIKLSYNTAQPSDWIQMNDGTLGSASSGATYAAANTFNLFSLFWNFPLEWTPFTDGLARGGSAAIDFAANRAMLMPATLGRVLANAAPSGATLHMNFTASGNIITAPNTSSIYNGTPMTFTNTGGALPAPLVPATVYYACNVSGNTFNLATSPQNANLGNIITLTTAGSGTNTLTISYNASVVAQITGESLHQLLGIETGAHTHPDNCSQAGGSQFGGNGITSAHNLFATFYSTALNTGDTPHNIMQPTSYVYVFVHL